MPTRRHSWVIDSIEEQVAAIEVDGETLVRLPQWVLPDGASAGDVLAVTHEVSAEGSVLRIEVDEAGKRKALRRSREQVAERSRPGSDPGGDITL